jgi:putative transposase
MPRRARILSAGIHWYIIQSSNNRSACFYADEDYHRSLETLCEQVALHDYIIHA